MKNTIDKLARELNLSPSVVEKVFEAYMLFIRTKIEELPLKKDLTEEDFNKLRTNFNLPNLGKLSCTYKAYIGQKKRLKKVKEYVKSNKGKTII